MRLHSLLSSLTFEMFRFVKQDSPNVEIKNQNCRHKFLESVKKCRKTSKIYEKSVIRTLAKLLEVSKKLEKYENSFISFFMILWREYNELTITH